jgi:hypothetical protein
MATTGEIVHFLIELSGRDDVTPNSDIFNDIHLVGDDFREMIEKFASKYSVDMTNYLWYFHADEEGGWNSLGGLFFDPPYKKINRIPVTPSMLTEFANKGKWDIHYPIHKLPTKRYDLIINQIVGILFLIIALIATINKCSKKQNE